jgi:enamine deaminase RidA (YjgF/YER057c/UK114 family)
MTSIAYLNPETMANNPAFSQAVRIPAGHDLIVIGGQNGVDASGAVVSDDLRSQTRQALDNLVSCLHAAGAELEDLVRCSILVKEGAPILEGFGAYMEVWGGRPNPPTVVAAFVRDLAVAGALIEIEALAAVPA